jgi:hypothetical protein
MTRYTALAERGAAPAAVKSQAKSAGSDPAVEGILLDAGFQYGIDSGMGNCASHTRRVIWGQDRGID